MCAVCLHGTACEFDQFQLNFNVQSRRLTPHSGPFRVYVTLRLESQVAHMHTPSFVCVYLSVLIAALYDYVFVLCILLDGRIRMSNTEYLCACFQPNALFILPISIGRGFVWIVRVRRVRVCECCGSV